MVVLGVIGYINSGKTTIAQYLNAKHDYKLESFAKPLKDAAAVIFNWDRELLEGSTPHSREWRNQPDEWWSAQLGRPITPRLVLQKLGTEAARHVFGNAIWVASLLSRIQSEPHRNFAISDCRFPDEAAVIKSLGGTLIKVAREPDPPYAGQLRRAMANGEKSAAAWMDYYYPTVHASEWNIALLEPDFVIQNDSTLEDLYTKVDTLLTLI